MARYIDADKFAENKQYLRARLEFPDGTKTNGYWAVLSSVVIKDAPSEDVAPVVHAQWLHNSRANAPRCSACGRTMDNATPYCPFCGAIMDKEDTQETHKEG